MIYFLRHPETGLIKIGKTKNYHQRLSQLIAEHGDLELLGIMQGYTDKECELHEQFSSLNVRGDLKGVEWFESEQSLLGYIDDNSSMNIPKPDGQPMVNVQIAEDVREMLGILKKRYNTPKMSDALKEFIREYDSDLVQAGEILIRVQRRATEDDV